jgi:hypothetical protein
MHLVHHFKGLLWHDSKLNQLSVKKINFKPTQPHFLTRPSVTHAITTKTGGRAGTAVVVEAVRQLLLQLSVARTLGVPAPNSALAAAALATSPPGPQLRTVNRTATAKLAASPLSISKGLGTISSKGAALFQSWFPDPAQPDTVRADQHSPIGHLIEE